MRNDSMPAEAGSGEVYAPFALERRGIDWIPETKRVGTSGQLARMWAGGLTGVGTLVYGLTVMSVGLSFLQGVLVIVFGNLSFLAVGICSLQGRKAGTTAMTISRAPYGTNGSRFIAFFNWLTVIGFETVAIALSTLAGTVLLGRAGLHVDRAGQVLLCVVAGLLLLILPWFGHATVSRVLRILLIPFALLFVIMVILTAGKVNLHAASHAANWQTVTVALAITISGSGLGWANQANDFSRYLPPDTPARAIVWKVTLGCYLPQTILMLLGAALGTAVHASNPFVGLPSIFPGWFLIPYILVAIAQILGGTSLDLYSSGLTLQTIGVRLRRSNAVLVDLAISIGLAIAVVLSPDFYTDFSDFLLFLIVWLAPWFGIFVTDWLLRRGTYDGPALAEGVQPYRPRPAGVYLPALIAQVAGMGACALWLNAYPVYIGPLSSRVGDSDFSIFCGVGVAAVTYLLLTRLSAPAGRPHPIEAGS